MANPVEEVIKALDNDKKEKAIEILRNFENLRIQFVKEIKDRADLSVANQKLESELEDSQKFIDKIKQNTEKLLMEQQEVDQKLNTDKGNQVLVARQQELVEDIQQIQDELVIPKKEHEKLKQSLDGNLQSLQKLNEKLKGFDEAQKAASQLLNGLNIKGEFNNVDLSFVDNVISAPKSQPQPKLPLQEGEQDKENKSPLGWDGSKRSIIDKNKPKTEPKMEKGSYFKPPEKLEGFLNSKQFSIKPSGEAWLCTDNTSPKSSYTIENGKVTTTGRSDDSLRNTIEIYMQGETIKNGGTKPDFTKMEVLATGPDRERMLEIAQKEYKIGTALNKKDTNTFGQTPPKKDDETPTPFKP